MHRGERFGAGEDSARGDRSATTIDGTIVGRSAGTDRVLVRRSDGGGTVEMHETSEEARRLTVGDLVRLHVAADGTVAGCGLTLTSPADAAEPRSIPDDGAGSDSDLHRRRSE
jgi:hypothetical protein